MGSESHYMSLRSLAASQVGSWDSWNWMTGWWFVAIFYFPIYWVAFIIPNDFHSYFFRGVAKNHQPDELAIGPLGVATGIPIGIAWQRVPCKARN